MNSTALNEEVLTDQRRMFLYLHDAEYHAKVELARRLLEAYEKQSVDGDIGLPLLFWALRDRLCGKEAEEANERVNDRFAQLRKLEGAAIPRSGYQREDPRHWGLDANWR